MLHMSQIFMGSQMGRRAHGRLVAAGSWAGCRCWGVGKWIQPFSFKVREILEYAVSVWPDDTVILGSHHIKMPTGRCLHESGVCLFPNLKEVQLEGAWRVIYFIWRRDTDAVSPAANVEKNKSPVYTMSYLPSVWECSEHLGDLKLHQMLTVWELNLAWNLDISYRETPVLTCCWQKTDCRKQRDSRSRRNCLLARNRSVFLESWAFTLALHLTWLHCLSVSLLPVFCPSFTHWV